MPSTDRSAAHTDCPACDDSTCTHREGCILDEVFDKADARSAATSFYAGGPTSWSRRLAERVKPLNIDGNMSFRANLWRALVDWGWGIDLETPRWRRLLWVYRRLVPDWMPMFFPKEDE